MGKISNTLSLMSDSWDVIKKSKEILTFQIISGFCCLVILAIFLLPMFKSGVIWEVPSSGSLMIEYIVYYGKLFILLLVNYFIMTFFNVAIVHCAMMRMDDQDVSFADGIYAALNHLPAILGWSLISATVGLILRIIADHSEFVGQLIASLIGAGWALASFLVVPVMVVDKEGPLSALSDSASLLKKSWGEQILGQISFGLVFFILSLAAIFPALYGFQADTDSGKIIGFGLAIIYIVALSVIQSAMQVVFQSALYLNVRFGETPEQFQSELLNTYQG